MKPYASLIFMALLLVTVLSASRTAAQQAVKSPVPPDSPDPVVVSVDWWEEIKKGGITCVALGVLSVAALAVCIERAMSLRRMRISPNALMKAIDAAEKDRNLDALNEACKKSPSTLAEVTRYVLKNLDRPAETVTNETVEMAGGEVQNHLSRIQLLSGIAALAPLLGLLGTIIGMIEAFKLVAMYGDEGGSAILSDSISKALITTAVGLDIAIPCMAAYYWFRHRVNVLTKEIEKGVSKVLRLVKLAPKHHNKSDTKNNSAIFA